MFFLWSPIEMKSFPYEATNRIQIYKTNRNHVCFFCSNSALLTKMTYGNLFIFVVPERSAYSEKNVFDHFFLLLFFHIFSVLSLQLKKLRLYNKSTVDLSNVDPARGHKEVRRSTAPIMVTARYSKQQGFKSRPTFARSNKPRTSETYRRQDDVFGYELQFLLLYLERCPIQQSRPYLVYRKCAVWR